MGSHQHSRQQSYPKPVLGLVKHGATSELTTALWFYFPKTPSRPAALGGVFAATFSGSETPQAKLRAIGNNDTSRISCDNDLLLYVRIFPLTGKQADCNPYVFQLRVPYLGLDLLDVYRPMKELEVF